MAQGEEPLQNVGDRSKRAVPGDDDRGSKGSIDVQMDEVREPWRRRVEGKRILLLLILSAGKFGIRTFPFECCFSPASPSDPHGYDGIIEVCRELQL